MDKDSVIIKLRHTRATRVRYHRAVLTIRRSGALNAGELGKAIIAYETGIATAEEVGWAFARSRVEAATASFDWDEAKLDRLLELVTRASTDPKLASAEPEAVAAALVEAAQDEAEQAKRATEAMRRNVDALIGRNSALAQFDKVIGLSRADRHILGQAGKHHERMQDLARRLDGHPGLKRMISPLGEDIAGFAGHRGVARTVRDALGLADGGLAKNSHLAEAMRSLGVAGFNDPKYKGMLADLARSRSVFGDLDPKYFQTPPWLEHLQEFGSGLQKTLRSWQENYERTLPANWRELEARELGKATKLMTEEGLALAWAPRLEIVRELLAADDHEARCQILLERSDEITDDVEAALELVEREELAPSVEAAGKAIAAYRDGHVDPAQAYVATIIADLVRVMGSEKFTKVRKTFGDVDPMHDVDFIRFPLYAVGAVWARALDHFKNAGTGFNRNTSAHFLGEHYSESNLIAGLLLLGGLLPELERELDRQERRRLAKAA